MNTRGTFRQSQGLNHLRKRTTRKMAFSRIPTTGGEEEEIVLRAQKKATHPLTYIAGTALYTIETPPLHLMGKLMV